MVVSVGQARLAPLEGLMHISPTTWGMKHGLEAGEVGQASIFREKFRRCHARFPFISTGEIHTLTNVCLGKSIQEDNMNWNCSTIDLAPHGSVDSSAGSHSSAPPRLGSCTTPQFEPPWFARRRELEVT